MKLYDMIKFNGMVRLSTITAMVLLLSVSCPAQLLYRITSPHTKHTNYLFATHHAVPVSSLKDVDGVFRCYNSCDAVIGEIVLDEDSVALLMASEAQMVSSISELLTKDDYAFVDSVLNAVVGLGLSQVAYLRPAMIENIFYLTLYEQQFPGGADDTQMDSFFQNAALQQGKSVYGLESIDEQLRLLFHTSTVQQQAKQLVSAMRNASALPSEIKHLNELYLSENLDSLYRWAVDVEGLTPDEYKRMVADRNLIWIERLDVLLKKEPCFIAVGALHLLGDDGLLALLAKKGYRVKAVEHKK